MADLNSKNRPLFIKRYQRDKMMAQAQIQSREVRIMELEEEIERCRMDIEAQNKVIVEMEFNIKQQHEEMEKEKIKPD